MKRFITLAATGVAALSLAACGGPSESEKFATSVDAAHVKAGQEVVNHGRSVTATSELSADESALRTQADDLRQAARDTRVAVTEKTPEGLRNSVDGIEQSLNALADTVESAADNPDKIDLIKQEFDSRVKALQQAIANSNSQVSR